MKKLVVAEFKPGEVLGVGRQYDADDCRVLGAAASRFWGSEGIELDPQSTFLFDRYNEGENRGTIQLDEHESEVLDRMNAIGLEVAKNVLGIEEIEPDIFAGVEFMRSQEVPKVDIQLAADDMGEVPLHNVYLLTPLNPEGMVLRVSDDPIELRQERDMHGRLREPFFYRDITLAFGETAAVHNMVASIEELPPRYKLFIPGIMSLIQDYPTTDLPDHIREASAQGTPGHIDF